MRAFYGGVPASTWIDADSRRRSAEGYAIRERYHRDRAEAYERARRRPWARLPVDPTPPESGVTVPEYVDAVF
jgi:hypothetical protein